jgi:chitosanase
MLVTRTDATSSRRPGRRTALVAALALVLLSPTVAQAAVSSDLAEPSKKAIALALVSSAENSTLQWRRQYRYIEDIGDGRGYTAGLVGFTSGTGDMLMVVRAYVRARPAHNPLRRFLPALRRVDGTASHRGLGAPFVRAWRAAAHDPRFRAVQEALRDRLYFDPAVALAKQDGLNALGQFAYFDAAVVHGYDGLAAVRTQTIATTPAPSQGGDEVGYLDAFLRERAAAMRQEAAHEDLSRIDDAQRRFLDDDNLDLHLPLHWSVYGDPYELTATSRLQLRPKP